MCLNAHVPNEKDAVTLARQAVWRSTWRVHTLTRHGSACTGRLFLPAHCMTQNAAA